MEADSDDERTSHSALFTAIRRGDLKKVIELLEKVDVHIVDKNNKDNSPLHYAVEKNRKMIVEVMLRSKWRKTIDSTNSSGNTPLHVGVYKDHREIVKLLLLKGAKQNVENKERQEPLDLAQNKRMKQIFQSYDEGSLEDETGEALVANEFGEQEKYDKKSGASGIRGHIYEISFSMLFLLHGTLEIEQGKMDSFLLAANLKPAGDFDDVVYKRVYRDEEGLRKSRVLFVQSKHKNREGEIVPMEKLLSSQDKKDDFSLKDYYRSYREIRDQFTEENAQDPIFESELEDCEFVILTNAVLGDYEGYEDHVREETVDEESVFKLEGANRYYKLSLGGSKDEELMGVMRLSSDCLKLAKELTEAVFSAKGIDLLSYATKKYHWALSNYVIEGKKANGKLRETFWTAHGATVLSTTFCDEVAKRDDFKGKGPEEVKLFLSSSKIKLPNNFGTIKGTDKMLPLPIDIVTENEVKAFFGKLKLFFGQPNDVRLGDIIKSRIGEAYRVTHPDMDTVYATVQHKVKSWWLNDNKYLTEDNRFFEETAKISLWFDVMEPGRLFTGRKAELRQLNSTLLRNRDKEECAPQSRMTWLSGLSGVGKTELARKYIRRYSREYDDNIVWINAETQESMIASFHKLARDKLNLPAITDEEDVEPRDVELIVAKVYEFFSRRSSLFIFNGVDGDVTRYQTFLPPDDLPPGTQRPYVLLTSSSDSWDETIESIKLEALTPMEATALVRKGMERTQETSKTDEISKLVKIMHYFPIAIERAVLYIRDEMMTREFTIEDYIGIYEKRWEELSRSNVLKEVETDPERAAVTTAIIGLDRQNLTQSGRIALEALRTNQIHECNEEIPQID